MIMKMDKIKFETTEEIYRRLLKESPIKYTELQQEADAFDDYESRDAIEPDEEDWPEDYEEDE